MPRPLLRCIQMRSVPGSQWKVFSSSQELRVSTLACGAKTGRDRIEISIGLNLLQFPLTVQVCVKVNESLSLICLFLFLWVCATSKTRVK